MIPVDPPPERESDSRLSRLVQRALTGFDDGDRYERRSRAARLRKMVGIGIPVYAAFAPLDLLYASTASAAPLAYHWVLRASGVLLLILTYLWLRRSKTPSQRALIGFDLTVVGALAVLEALFVLGTPGVGAPVATGILLILLARAIAISDPWPRGLVLTATPAALFAGTLALAMLVDPGRLAAVDPALARADAAMEAGSLAAAIALLVAGSHFSWQLRRELFRARRFGRYRLRERIAGGGMGEVWVAENQPLRQDVALKILPLASGKDPTMVARFEREVLATSRLRHPNTVRVYDFGMSEDGYWYYAMELLEGETLAQKVAREGPLAPERSIRLIEQVASALADAHRHRVIHRDIKPSNLFLCNPVDGEDFVKVLDFGVARLVGADLSGAGGGAGGGADWAGGTPLFVSPEVARGELADARSDIYGLGCCLYFLLTGRAPFVGDDATDLLLAHVRELPASPSAVLGRRIPRVIEALVMRCLEKDPERRYASAGELVDALEAIDQHLSGPRPAARAVQTGTDGWLEHTVPDLSVLEP